VFSRFANRFSVCDLWSDSGKVFHVFQYVAIFRESKTWLDAREDEGSKLAERRSRKMRWLKRLDCPGSRSFTSAS
jgi:hypothetical protein